MAAAALVATLGGGALTACGTHSGAHSTATSARVAPSSPATPSAAPASASAPAKPSRQPSGPSSPASSAPASDGKASAPAGKAPGTPSHPAGASGAAPGKAPGSSATVPLTISHGVEGGGKSVALTFDDGPDPRWTPQVLALLAKHHAKATFCEIGPNAQRYPYLTKEIVAAGDRLCDHSVHHDEKQSGKGFDYNVHEIVDAQNDIAGAAGNGGKVWYYRAPGGDFSPMIRGIAADHGLRPLGWTDDANDWRRPGVDGILRNVNSNLRPGAVILMHDGGGDRSQTVAALARLLDQLDAQGYGYAFPAR
ncbi:MULTISPECIES: polysaccharide deacetylase family protein [Streptomycetaceae]|nr:MULTISPECIES: polysaccharide deacetylase family protein [Streptomycetaceae]MYS57287.1 polysaccharide deacetylase family protein [Streptomyces sp. SID5468]CCB72844.1 Oligosaccharide deacetylase [Streptantibioticus cattleyicolor NRRL 8057 = DSM 46488]